jgi:hypothetical protein
MLRRVRSGTTLTSVPRGEVDLSVDIPIVTVTDGGRTGATTSRWETVAITGNPPAPSRPRRGLLVAMLAVVAAVVVAVAGFGARTRLGTTVSVAPENPPAASSAASVSSIASATMAAAAESSPASSLTSEVVIHIETSPPGARVLMDGTDRGPTPLEVRVPRSDKHIALAVRRPGYAPLIQDIVPQDNQRLVLTLTAASQSPRHVNATGTRLAPSPTSEPAAAAPTPPPATAPTASGFTRFE